MSFHLKNALVVAFAAASLLTACRSEKKHAPAPFKPGITAHAGTGTVVKIVSPRDVISVDYIEGALTETLYASGTIDSPRDSVNTIQYKVCFENMDSADVRTVRELRQYLPAAAR